MADTDGPEERSLFARCLSEAIGTALLVSIGLSIVIFNEGHASPLANVLPSEAARRALTGLLFGTTGMTIALSPVGRVSGAHINPMVSLAFWFEKTLPGRTLVLFITAR